jgi:PBP1b-binding outer membrane lipoprotein LpoB
MKLHKIILTALLSAFLITGLSACEKGPAEKAGKAIDDAASDVADTAEEATDAVKEKME